MTKSKMGGNNNQICVFFLFVFILFVCVNGRGREAPEKPLENNDLYTWWCTGNCGQIPQVVNPTYGYSSFNIQFRSYSISKLIISLIINKIIA